MALQEACVKYRVQFALRKACVKVLEGLAKFFVGFVLPLFAVLLLVAFCIAFYINIPWLKAVSITMTPSLN